MLIRGAPGLNGLNMYEYQCLDTEDIVSALPGLEAYQAKMDANLVNAFLEYGGNCMYLIDYFNFCNVNEVPGNGELLFLVILVI